MLYVCFFFFFKQKTAYELRISDWSSDVCSSDLSATRQRGQRTIFCHLPLQDGVSTVSGWPPSSTTRAVSIIALSANALPVSRCHQRQWQQCTTRGIAVRRVRTARQVPPPSCAASWSVIASSRPHSFAAQAS